jgi:hypothetical protein
VKRIGFCIEELCTVCLEFILEKTCMRLMNDHVQYLNILAQSMFYKSLLIQLEKLIKSHHLWFVQFYTKPKVSILSSTFILPCIDILWSSSLACQFSTPPCTMNQNTNNSVSSNNIKQIINITIMISYKKSSLTSLQSIIQVQPLFPNLT